MVLRSRKTGAATRLASEFVAPAPSSVNGSSRTALKGTTSPETTYCQYLGSLVTELDRAARIPKLISDSVKAIVPSYIPIPVNYYSHLLWCGVLWRLNRKISLIMLGFTCAAIGFHRHAFPSPAFQKAKMSQVLKATAFCLLSMCHMTAMGGFGVWMGHDFRQLTKIGTFVFTLYKLVFVVYALAVHSFRGWKHSPSRVAWSLCLHMVGSFFRCSVPPICMAMYVTLSGISYDGISVRDTKFFNFDWHWKDFIAAQTPAPLWTFLLPLAWTLLAEAMHPGWVQLYFVHKLLHENPALYLYIHKVHHLAVNPIFSDGGTESPIEFGFDEVNVFTFLHPIGYLLAATLLVFNQFSDHDCYFNNVLPNREDHHYKHHKLVSGNFSVPPYWDEINGTIIPTDKHVNLTEYNNSGKAE